VNEKNTFYSVQVFLRLPGGKPEILEHEFVSREDACNTVRAFLLIPTTELVTMGKVEK